MQKAIGFLNLIALCPYQLSKCELLDVINIVRNHHFSFLKSKFHWKTLTNPTKYEHINLVGKMAASVAHEIRNPMATVRGFIQLLGKKAELALYQDYFTLMIEELDRANGIIAEYLSLATEPEKDIRLYNLNEIILAILPLLQADALREGKNVSFSAGETAEIAVDAREIRKVIYNLVRNGLEAMEKGGRVDIRTCQRGKAVIMEIADTGGGIPGEVLHKLGEPFVTTKGSGTGLGLAVSMRILERYHAGITVQSSPHGTTFTVAFPLPESAASNN